MSFKTINCMHHEGEVVNSLYKSSEKKDIFKCITCVIKEKLDPEELLSIH